MGARPSRSCTVCLAALALLGRAAAAETLDPLPVLAEVGPWPVLSQLIGFDRRLWFANSVKGRNHNSADLYSYDPRTGALRYEKHLFSQDVGRPLALDGRLYWPYEDSRFSLGWGAFQVTDGVRWQSGTIPTARIFHTHALVQAGGRLVAATSAWRAGFQVSTDGGGTWRQVYDHPTPERQVSRMVTVEALGPRVFGVLLHRDKRRLLLLDGERVAEVPGWPKDRPVLGLAPFRGGLYGAVQEADGVAIWRSDGVTSARLAPPRAGWRVRNLAAGAGRLWAVSADGDGGVLWSSPDGARWTAQRRLDGGTPWEVAVYGGDVYVAGAGADGRGRLWGPAPPAPVEPGPAARAPLPVGPRPAHGPVDGAAIDGALLDPASYRDRRILRDLVYDAALRPGGAAVLGTRLGRALPERTLSLIGGRVQVPAADLGRWILLWGLAKAGARQGAGRVPPALIAEPWTQPENSSQKYFAAPPAAIWAAAAANQNDRATLEALIGRLNRPDDPLWLRGDAIGALTTLTGRTFAYDQAAWQAWWTQAAPHWPRQPTDNPNP
jgi:hypothetical protein